MIIASQRSQLLVVPARKNIRAYQTVSCVTRRYQDLEVKTEAAEADLNDRMS